IESYVTPRREVSLYRAAGLYRGAGGDVVVCSNSPAALRRVLDVRAGKGAALAKAPDFRYMRTTFVRNAKVEDGFVFLSDAFIRRLVGPATRIKAWRRAEARAALTLAGEAALFTGWETGKLPADTRALLAGAALKPAVLEVPEGKPVAWDGVRGEAF